MSLLLFFNQGVPAGGGEDPPPVDPDPSNVGLSFDVAGSLVLQGQEPDIFDADVEAFVSASVEFIPNSFSVSLSQHIEVDIFFLVAPSFDISFQKKISAQAFFSQRPCFDIGVSPGHHFDMVFSEKTNESGSVFDIFLGSPASFFLSFSGSANQGDPAFSDENSAIVYRRFII